MWRAEVLAALRLESFHVDLQTIASERQFEPAHLLTHSGGWRIVASLGFDGGFARLRKTKWPGHADGRQPLIRLDPLFADGMR